MNPLGRCMPRQGRFQVSGKVTIQYSLSSHLGQGQGQGKGATRMSMVTREKIKSVTIKSQLYVSPRLREPECSLQL